MVKGAPAQLPPEEVGVTTYSTVPVKELLGLVNTWLMVAPEPADEPVMPLVIVPIVQLKLLATLDVKAIFVETPLQILFVDELVTAGEGFTVTVIVVELPAQEPPVEVGVTTYSILPTTALLGFVRV